MLNALFSFICFVGSAMFTVIGAMVAVVQIIRGKIKI